MFNIDKYAIAELRRVLDEIHYSRYLYTLRRKPHFLSIWPEVDWLKKNCVYIPDPLVTVYKLLIYGYKVDECEVEKAFSKGTIESLMKIGLLIRDEDKLFTGGFSILCYLDHYFVVSISPDYCSLHEDEIHRSDIYIGLDSLLLAGNLRYNGKALLDLCAGSGFQGILAALAGVDRVVSVDLNPLACNIIGLNAALNGVADKITVLHSNLFDGIDERFDMILANPPYIPIPREVSYYLSGDGGEDGLTVIREILDKTPLHIKSTGELWMIGEAVQDKNGEFLWNKEFHSLEQKGYEINMNLYPKKNMGIWATDVAEYWLDGRKDISDKDLVRTRLQEYYKNTFTAVYAFLLQVVRK